MLLSSMNQNEKVVETLENELKRNKNVIIFSDIVSKAQPSTIRLHLFLICNQIFF
jgi:hypothetical protein